MRIESLSITRFKCLLKLSLEGLARITLLGGPNGVGKTSVLEAIFLFFDRYNPGVLLNEFKWRGVKAVRVEPGEMAAPFFFDFDMQKDITISLTMGRRRERLTISCDPSLSTDIPVGQVENQSQTRFIRTEGRPSAPFALVFSYQHDKRGNEVSRLVAGQNGVVFQGDKPGIEARLANIIFAGHAGTSLNDALRFGELVKANQEQEAVEFIRQFFPHLRALSTIPGADQRPVLYADVGLSRKVPIGWAGEGLSRLLSIYLAMACARNGVALVDEIGAGIHYSALPKMWEAIAQAAEKYQCQVFATTHSYECISAAKDGLSGLLKPDFVYVLLDRTEKGIVPKFYPYEVLGAALEAHLELRGER